MALMIMKNPDYQYTGEDGVKYNAKGMYFKNKNAVENLIRYILRRRTQEDRIADLKSWGIFGMPCTDNVEILIQIMQETQTVYRKTEGRHMYHFVLTFSDPEKQAIGCNYSLVHQMSLEIGRYFYDQGFQNIFAVHDDPQKRVHVHFAVNSVSFLNGIKYHLNHQDVKVLQDFCAQVVNKYIGNISAAVRSPIYFDNNAYMENVQVHEQQQTAYFGVYGDNGFGVYTDRMKLDNDSGYLANPYTLEFQDVSNAYCWAQDNYNALQEGGDVDAISEGHSLDCRLNWIVFKSDIVKRNQMACNISDNGMKGGYYGR